MIRLFLTLTALVAFVLFLGASVAESHPGNAGGLSLASTDGYMHACTMEACDGIYKTCLQSCPYQKDKTFAECRSSCSASRDLCGKCCDTCKASSCDALRCWVGK